MINDAGKHNVKTPALAVTLSACEHDTAAALCFAGNGPGKREGEDRVRRAILRGLAAVS